MVGPPGTLLPNPKSGERNFSYLKGCAQSALPGTRPMGGNQPQTCAVLHVSATLSCKCPGERHFEGVHSGEKFPARDFLGHAVERAATTRGNYLPCQEGHRASCSLAARSSRRANSTARLPRPRSAARREWASQNPWRGGCTELGLGHETSVPLRDLDPALLCHPCRQQHGSERHGLGPQGLGNVGPRLGAGLPPVLKLACSLIELVFSLQRGSERHDASISSGNPASCR